MTGRIHIKFGSLPSSAYHSLNPTMHKVVDAGALYSDELAAFFAASRDNVAVITDIMSIEALKREGLRDDDLHYFRRAFQTLADNSGRVVVLRSTPELAKTIPRVSAVPASLYDLENTASFSDFCAVVLGNGTPSMIAHVQANQVRSRQFMEKLTAQGSEMMRSGIGDMATLWPPDIIKEFVQGSLGSAFFRHAHSSILCAAAERIEHAFPNNPLAFAGNGSVPEELLYWQPFRYAVAMHALAATWVGNRGYETAKAERLRNDSIDMFYVAYGTYFDGVITRDNRLCKLWELTTMILRNAFGIEAVAASSGA
jgi:hypothetical protein